VCGLGFDAGTAEARLYVEVLALPEVGPIEPDLRRVIVFGGASSIEVILRKEEDGLGEVLPLRSMDELEDFFASLAQADAMYGWSFIDAGNPGEDWKVPRSLVQSSSTSHFATHTIHWFSECGRPAAGDRWERYYLQGVIHFDSLRVERPGHRAMDLDEFLNDARRWWDAFEARDLRLTSEAQQHAQAARISWRGWGGTSVMVSGGSG
jgi:hypothetical protein